MEAQRRMKTMQQKFRMKGFTLTLDALKAAVGFINESSLSPADAMEALLASTDSHHSLKSNMLDKGTIMVMIDGLKGLEDPKLSKALQVVDAFELPKVIYDPVRKIMYTHAGNLEVHGDASAKASLYRNRFQLLQQRLMKDKHFVKPAFEGHQSTYGSCEITPLQSLVGSSGSKWVMGVISQLEDGRFHLEDLSAVIPVDFTDAKITAGFFTENTIVLAEGELEVNGTFKIHTMGFPPLERRQASLQAAAGINFLGGPPLSIEEVIRLEKMEKQAVNDMFVVLSDVWVDSVEVMAKLEQVLDGYESMEVVPSVFILMGNFTSYACNLAAPDFTELRAQFEKLGALIADHPRIKDGSQFILVPGPGDPGPSRTLPRPALPKYFTKEILKHVPNAICTTNPCRIRFYAQDIVVFREDMQYKMRRAVICKPSEEETSDPFEHMVVTMLHQSHLCPLPLTMKPIIWNFDHALTLYPTPDTIILGDIAAQNVKSYMGVTCFNPGSFASDDTFIAYRPATREVEMSAIGCED